MTAQHQLPCGEQALFLPSKRPPVISRYKSPNCVLQHPVTRTNIYNNHC